jgi:regulator of sigma E protease
MIYLSSFLNFLLSLSLLIILHELGHFIPAKFKTRVEKILFIFLLNIPYLKRKLAKPNTVLMVAFGGYVKYQDDR